MMSEFSTTKNELEDYKRKVSNYLKTNMKHSVKQINQELEEYDKIIAECYNKGFRVSAMATMIGEEL